MIDTLPPLRDVIAAHGLTARKALGQNFLLDLNLTARIARIPGDLSETDVLEVGPGPGGLTRGLLASGARHVLAVEKDPRCLPALAEIAAAYPGRLTVIEGDAREIDPTEHLQGPIAVVANLPYNVGTDLLTSWLDPGDDPGLWPPFWSSLTLMFQREVAERIVAKSGSKAYGRLSVLAAWRTEAKLALPLPPAAFTPPPKVSSAVVHLTPNLTPMEANPTMMRNVVAKAFGQRRKMLRASLKGVTSDILSVLERADIDPTRRAETLSVTEYIKIVREVTAANHC